MSKETSIPVVDEDAAGEAAAGAAPEQVQPEQVQPEEAQPEQAAPEQAAPAAVADAGELLAQLEQARRELEDQQGEVLRARAEMENVRRRSARDVENARKFGVERLICDLLPVRDSMELGLRAAAEEGAGLDKVREGLDLTLKMLAGAMDKFELEAVDPIGQPFDPEFHEAMSMQPAPDTAPDTVITVFQKGYVLAGRLVRPAMVVVARGPDG